MSRYFFAPHFVGYRRISGIVVGMQWDGVHTLVEQVQAGDQQAWTRLEVLARPYLLRLAQQFLGPDWPQQSVRDLLQDTWVRAFQGLPTFQPGAGDEQTAALLRAWLRKIMRNVHLNDRRYHRAERRKLPAGMISLDTVGAADSTSAAPSVEPTAADPTASANLYAEERTRKIQDALDRLTDPADRDVIRLYFFEGRSLAQIAQELGRTYDDVRGRFHKCLTRLRPELRELAHDFPEQP